MDRHNQFLEPERGSGIVGWAVKQLVMWLIGGLVVYTLVVNFQLLKAPAPQAAPQSTASQSNGVPLDDQTVLKPLGNGHGIRYRGAGGFADPG